MPVCARSDIPPRDEFRLAFDQCINRRFHFFPTLQGGGSGGDASISFSSSPQRSMARGSGT
jgi:hypothetical protein